MKIECEHCGELRDENKAIPCPKCNSRQYLFVGYLYPNEVRSTKVLFFCLAILLLIAIIVGLIYLVSIYGLPK
jgi:hypothetical protein